MCAIRGLLCVVLQGVLALMDFKWLTFKTLEYKKEFCLTSVYLPLWALQLWDHMKCTEGSRSSNTKNVPTGCSLCKHCPTLLSLSHLRLLFLSDELPAHNEHLSSCIQKTESIIKTSKISQCASQTFCRHDIFPPLLTFHPLRTSSAEKLDWEDVYFPLNPVLFKIEPTFVRLILLLFETVYVTGNLNTVWRGLTSLVYLH